MFLPVRADSCLGGCRADGCSALCGARRDTDRSFLRTKAGLHEASRPSYLSRTFRGKAKSTIRSRSTPIDGWKRWDASRWRQLFRSLAMAVPARSRFTPVFSQLATIGVDDWLVLPGPANRVAFTRNQKLTQYYRSRLEEIAALVRRHGRVDIVELGPFTVSASLIMHGLVEPERIAKILGVGGRAPGDDSTREPGCPLRSAT